MATTDRAKARLSERIGELDLPPKGFDPLGGFFSRQVFLEQLRLVNQHNRNQGTGSFQGNAG